MITAESLAKPQPHLGQSFHIRGTIWRGSVLSLWRNENADIEMLVVWAPDSMSAGWSDGRDRAVFLHRDLTWNHEVKRWEIEPSDADRLKQRF